MADAKISALAAVATPASTDVLPIVSSSVTKKVSIADLVNAAPAVSKVTITPPATSATLTIANGKTLTVSNTLTLAGTDGSTLNVGAGGTLGAGAFAPVGANLALDNLASVAINTSLLPGTSDGAALGSSTKMWSDLFLADGGVINWNNGDVLITHTTNKLTISGAASGVEVNPVVAGVAAGGLFIGAPATKSLDSGAISDQLHVQGSDAKNAVIVIDSFAAPSVYMGRRSGGTDAAKTATGANVVITGIHAQGYEPTTPAYTASRAVIELTSGELFSLTGQGTYIDFKTTLIGTTTTSLKMRLSDAGNLKLGGTASRGTTQGTAHVDLFDGTAPAGTLTNGVSIYSSGGNLYAMNAAGTASQLTGGVSDTARLTINAVPTFDLAAGGLAVAEIVPFASTVTVATGKTFDHIRLSKTDGDYNTFILQGTGSATGLNVQAKIDSTSAAGSYFYGATVNILNQGPGTTRGFYARVASDTGSTGNIYGGAFAVSPNATTGTAYILQLEGNTFTDGVLWIVSDSGPGNAEVLNDGIIFHPDISIASGGAFVKGYQTVGQDGDFLSYKTQASAVLFTVNKDGQLGIGVTPDASSALRIDSTTGALLPPRMTTTQRDALTAIDGHLIYNSTTGDLNYRKAGAWSPVSPDLSTYATLNVGVNAQTGTTYTLQASDNGKVVSFSNAGAITVTVPTGLGAGFNCFCVQLGAGQVTFSPSSTTVNNRQSHTKIAGQYGVASLVAYAANTFALGGDTAA